MSPDPHRPARSADSRDAEVPASLLAYETGLTSQRFRQLIAGEDAYTRPERPGSAG